jgi:multiple sugar transport system ATP-binding protein
VPSVEFRRMTKIYQDGTPAVTDLDLTVANGEFLCFLGPSGCGKSSTLRTLAGLELITSGDIFVDDLRINDVPPQRRDMAMVFENYALYPHLKVFDNIAMPLVARSLRKAEVQDRVRQVAETLRISDHLNKRPGALSGGQRQRVALARAIVRTPKIFLMDEPLGHLEAYLRVQLRSEIRRVHESLGTTTVYITHDQEEAAALSDRIVVMNRGKIQQIGTLLDLLDRPANLFVAEFIGSPPINVLPVSWVDGGARLSLGGVQLPLLAPSARAALLAPEVGRTLSLGIRADDISLASAPGDTRLPARVVILELQGETTRLITDTPVGRVNVMVPAANPPQVGQGVQLALDLSRAHLFAENGAAVLRGLARG